MPSPTGQTTDLFLFVYIGNFTFSTQFMWSSEELNVQVLFSQLKLTDSDIAEGAEIVTAELQKKLSQSPI